MKQIIRREFAILLAAVLCGCSLSACGTSETVEQSSYTGDTIENALEGVTLSVATTGLFAPFTYYDEDGTTLIGFDLDLLSALQELLGFEVEGGAYQAMEYGAIYASVGEGKIDLACGGMSYSDERAEVMNFVEPYADNSKELAINTETSPKELTSVDQLESGDYVVAVEKGTSSHMYASEHFPSECVEVHDTITTAFESLEQGKIDCLIQDTPNMEYYLRTKTDTKLATVGGTFYEGEQYAMALSFAICEENPQILDIFNQAIEELNENGTMEELKSKWGIA